VQDFGNIIKHARRSGWGGGVGVFGELQEKGSVVDHFSVGVY